MGNADRNALGKEFGSSKRDWTLYVGGGRGGGGGATVAGVNRYTFWIDHSKFDTYIRRLITQNVSFEIWKDSGLTQPAAFYLDVGMSNDKPDALIRNTLNQQVNGSLLIDSATTPPPYYINTTFLSQPTDPNYQTDQGRWNYNQYTSNGLGTGNNNKLVQSFVPSSPFLSGLKFRDFFHAATNSDHTTYNNLIFEVWDTNKNVLASFSLSPYKDAALTQVGSAGWSSISWVTADDGLVYWTDFKDVLIPITAKLVPGLTHYFCIKQDAASASHHYGIGSNTTGAGAWDGDTSHYYINGQAYTAPYASTVLTTAVSANVSLCFLSLRNNGRTGFTFLWDSSSYYWYNPASFLDQFRFVKADTDKRI